MAAWQGAIAERRSHDLMDLPLVGGTDWDSDSTKPVSSEQLQRLHAKLLQYFRADPSVLYWELGLEENLGWRSHRTTWTSYWKNLEAKARTIRAAADEVNPKIKLIYQIAEKDLQSVEDFCRSDAAGQFDVLSLHPYSWPDFRLPEQWMPDYVGKVRDLMRKNHAEKPIWFTEIGAPLDGNPNGFFGYPSIPAFDRGLSRDEHGAYLAQCFLEALRLGVEKVFWYTYADGGDNPEYAEDFFGMIDARGYPKPSYLAFCTLTAQLGRKPFTAMKTLSGGVRAYRFTGKTGECVAVCTYPAGMHKTSLSALEIKPGMALSITDSFGKPVPVTEQLEVSEYPLYIRLK